MISQLLSTSNTNALNIFDQVVNYCEERGIAKALTNVPNDYESLKNKCNVMEKILHKFCEPFEELPPNNYKLATSNMMEILMDYSAMCTYRDNPQLFTTSVVNSKLRFMHAALAPY